MVSSGKVIDGCYGLLVLAGNLVSTSHEGLAECAIGLWQTGVISSQPFWKPYARSRQFSFQSVLIYSGRSW